MTLVDGKTVVWDVPETPAEVAQYAMRTVAANATSAEDARELLAMLGLIEGESAGSSAPIGEGQCTSCAIPLFRKHKGECKSRPEGTRTYGAKGMCTTCYQRELYSGRAVAS